MGSLRSGADQFGVRWNTVRDLRSLFTISCMICIPVAPVPIMPIRLFDGLQFWGQRVVWKHSPSKSWTPSIAGRVGLLKMPIAVMTNLEVYVRFSESVRIHDRVSSCQFADWTSTSNFMCRRRSNFFVTNSAYRRLSTISTTSFTSMLNLTSLAVLRNVQTNPIRQVLPERKRIRNSSFLSRIYIRGICSFERVSFIVFDDFTVSRLTNTKYPLRLSRIQVRKHAIQVPSSDRD